MYSSVVVNACAAPGNKVRVMRCRWNIYIYIYTHTHTLI